jgi:hypothetical protein
LISPPFPLPTILLMLSFLLLLNLDLMFSEDLMPLKRPSNPVSLFFTHNTYVFWQNMSSVNI